MKVCNVLLRGGPKDGCIAIVDDNCKIKGGVVYETPDRVGAQGWYGCVSRRDGSWLVDNQGFLILVWCGWDGEGIE